METKEGAFYASSLRVFKSVLYFNNNRHNRIADKLMGELLRQKISKLQFAKMCGLSRDTVLRYTNLRTKDTDMNVELLKKMEEVLRLPKYTLCTRYHQFSDSVDGAQWLKDLRKSYKMTQADFAQKMMVPLYRYKGYEEGRVKVPYEIWKRGN
nr:helix-turn-helix transcriptional regulator [uncultured Lachnoclostridium sp.]